MLDSKIIRLIIVKSTSIYVTWLNSWDKDTRITVNRDIHIVYNALKQEGVKVEIILVDDSLPNGLKTVEIDEVDYDESKDITYYLEVDLPNSDISTRKLNQLVEHWGVCEDIETDGGSLI